MEAEFNIRGQFVDIKNRSIYPAEVSVSAGHIKAIDKIDDAPEKFILPGFIDAHVHIESSMLLPAEFARLAVVHGTVAVVSDPHEIANVCGMDGINYMIENSKKVNFKFYFGAPSCVPATTFETSGATINSKDIDELLQRDEILYLAEMMNWPGVIHKEEEAMQKINLARKHGKPIDGHAPGLRGEQAALYTAGGISTDHECFQYEEAVEKLSLGMKIIIREGSAAKNFNELIDLIDHHAQNLMFCSDDKHPDSLAEGHINQLAARAMAKGKDLFDVLQVACINPINHYGLQVGQLRPGDPADFILADNLKDFKIEKTFINGQLQSEFGVTKIQHQTHPLINNFDVAPKTKEDFLIKAPSNRAWVIHALDRQLVTKGRVLEIKTQNGYAISDPERDVLKIAIINRYQHSQPAVAFIKNFGLKKGAIASSVAHDSHNIVVVGTDDEFMAKSVNLIIENKGGLSVVSSSASEIVPLPVGGLMSAGDGYQIAADYTKLDKMAKELGTTLQSPFMTLSFMALLVIPEIKLSDKGLFDGITFGFLNVFV
jgi:adenine deaminase